MKKNKKNFFNIFIVLVVSISLISFFMDPFINNFGVTSIDYSRFYKELNNNNIQEMNITKNPSGYAVLGKLKTEVKNDKTKQIKSKTKELEKFEVLIPNDAGTTKDINQKMIENKIKVKYNVYRQPITFMGVLSMLLTIGFIVFLVISFNKMMKQQGRAMDFANNKSKKVISSDIKFDDVAGYSEEKHELIEIVDFLKNPLRYTKMGARVPKGILLVGPPGTGKTLLAKAVAGEAGVNFMMQSGSEFVEMFVGVGASRARNLFNEAKKNAPCIIFIDEIDAIGRRRGSGLGGGNDEKEQTLNQILIEMDGFLGNSGVVVMAATNRVDVLDPALLRPGRFDRQVRINLPNLKERVEILKLHASKRVIKEEVNLEELAKNTAGFSGAQLENIINEAAIIAVRENKKEIDRQDLSEAIDRVIMGPAKKTRKYTEEDKKIISYHEVGHVVVGLDLEDADVIQKVTIIPRGDAGGYASYAPKEDRFNYTKDNLLEKIIGLLGGRAGEETFCNVQTAGVHNDIERATKIARSMVVEYGMSDLGLYQYIHREDQEYGHTNITYSEETREKIDAEIKKIIDECYAKALEILKRREEDVHLIANALMERETLERSDIDYLLEHGKLPEYVESEKYTEEEIKKMQDLESAIKEKAQQIKEENAKNKK